jgi:hypothetical protein
LNNHQDSDFEDDDFEEENFTLFRNCQPINTQSSSLSTAWRKKIEYEQRDSVTQSNTFQGNSILSMLIEMSEPVHNSFKTRSARHRS